MPFGRSPLGGAPSAGGRALGSGGQRPLSDINVTPLVDVMLVLLVIFIITAPLMTRSIPLDLPQSSAAQPSPNTPSLSLAINVQGQVYVDGHPVDATQLAAALARAAAQSHATEVQLRADRAVPYGRIVELMDALNRAGLARIAFVTDTKAPATPAAPPLPPGT
ncbi:MAG: biopolymer transporter ExbD [Burkholderiaceae bacterium]|jgi:biopolymer transport protein TolR|nr:biopolymer transporter ExbD [Burkholderiaceae bacterium]